MDGNITTTKCDTQWIFSSLFPSDYHSQTTEITPFRRNVITVTGVKWHVASPGRLTFRLSTEVDVGQALGVVDKQGVFLVGVTLERLDSTDDHNLVCRRLTEHRASLVALENKTI